MHEKDATACGNLLLVHLIGLKFEQVNLKDKKTNLNVNMTFRRLYERLKNINFRSGVP